VEINQRACGADVATCSTMLAPTNPVYLWKLMMMMTMMMMMMMMMMNICSVPVTYTVDENNGALLIG